MIIPIIFCLNPACSNLIHTWVFCKGIDIAKYYYWPVFAQKQYFDNKENFEKNAYALERVANQYDYEPFQKENTEKIVCEIFPENIIQNFIEQYPSQTDAYIASGATHWQEMQTYFVQRVKELEQQLGEKAEAFLCLCHIQFIRDAADELKIPIIYYEWGTFREPLYRSSAILDLTGDIFTKEGDMRKRYEIFQKRAKNLPMFTRREILALFLRKEHLHYATDEDKIAEYDIGLAFAYHIPTPMSLQTQITSTELMTKAEQMFPSNKIIVRYHPGDPVHVRLYGAKEGEGFLPDFLQSCKRIVCISSNINYESMLYNRPVYDLGISQYQAFVNSSLDGLPDHIADDTFINFIAFGYLVPFEMIKNVEYLRWRLSHPKEEEIYRYHLDYYLNCLGLPKNILTQPAGTRLDMILERRKRPEQELQKEEIWMETTELTRMYIREERTKIQLGEVREKNCALQEANHTLQETNGRLEATNHTLQETNGRLEATNHTLQETNCTLKKTNCALQEANCALQNELQEIYNSRSWRLTQVLRKIKNLILPKRKTGDC